jgi:hypothetical protein
MLVSVHENLRLEVVSVGAGSLSIFEHWSAWQFSDHCKSVATITIAKVQMATRRLRG